MKSFLASISIFIFFATFFYLLNNQKTNLTDSQKSQKTYHKKGETLNKSQYYEQKRKRKQDKENQSKPQINQYPIDNTLKDALRYYNLPQLERLVKDYTTDESVIYNLSKSWIKKLHDQAAADRIWKAVYQRGMNEDRAWDCLFLAAAHSDPNDQALFKMLLNKVLNSYK